VKVLRAILLRLTGRRERRSRERGQSMVEMALTFPILLLVLAGTVEIGIYYNNYLTLVDATRESARFWQTMITWPQIFCRVVYPSRRTLLAIAAISTTWHPASSCKICSVSLLIRRPTTS